MKVSVEEARRIAVRAQALDGSASGVLETVRRLGFLQIDVVQPVERPQHLVLYSRLGPGYDRASSTGSSGRSALSSSGMRSSTRSRTCHARPRADPRLPPLAPPRRASAGCASS